MAFASFTSLELAAVAASIYSTCGLTWANRKMKKGPGLDPDPLNIEFEKALELDLGDVGVKQDARTESGCNCSLDQVLALRRRRLEANDFVKRYT